MRIGIDATPLPKEPVGAGTYIIQLIRALIAQSTKINTFGKEFSFYIFAHPSGQKLIDIPSSPRVNWITLSEKRPAHRLLWEQTMLPFLALHYKIGLLHSLHYTRPAILPCPSVVTFHDMTFLLYPYMHTRVKRVFFPIAIRYSAGHSHALIATSERTRQDTINLLDIPPEKITAIPNGISEEFHPISDQSRLEECRRKHKLPNDFILYVGLIEPRKNIPLLLRAYARLAQQSDCPSLVIAGRLGWMVDDVAQLLKTLDLQGKVRLTGYLPAQDLPMVYNLARIFVYPSIYEGFGFPPLEAMSCGIPVITTSVSPFTENVGDSGILVPPQNEDALYEAMKNLLGDRELQKELSIKGRRQSANFTWMRTAQETLRVYQRIETLVAKRAPL